MALTSKLLTVAEFSALLNITPACTRRWLLERKIAHIKIGRLVRISPEEAERLIADGLRPRSQRRDQ
jgi:excisionase family DNA binding protein